MEVTARAVSALCVLLTLFGEPVVADDIMDSKKSETHSLVNGNEQPDKIPDFIKYSFFFSDYEGAIRPTILERLDPNDDAKLMRTATEHESWLARENDRNESEFARRCWKSGPVDYIAYVRDREESAILANKRRDAHYKKIIASLSDNGKEVVSQFIETRITPNLSSLVPSDEPYWKTLTLDDARYEYEVDCYQVANGRLPPDLEARMQRAAEDAIRDFEQENEIEGEQE